MAPLARVGFRVQVEQAVVAAAAVLLAVLEELHILVAHTGMAVPVALTVAAAVELVFTMFIVGVA